MKVVIVEPGLQGRCAEIGEGPAAMQQVVGGSMIQIHLWKKDAAIVCSGQQENAVPNRVIPRYGAIRGTFYICGMDRSGPVGLSEAQIQKYLEMFSGIDCTRAASDGTTAQVDPQKKPGRKKGQEER